MSQQLPELELGIRVGEIGGDADRPLVWETNMGGRHVKPVPTAHGCCSPRCDNLEGRKAAGERGRRLLDVQYIRNIYG